MQIFFTLDPPVMHADRRDARAGRLLKAAGAFLRYQARWRRQDAAQLSYLRHLGVSKRTLRTLALLSAGILQPS